YAAITGVEIRAQQIDSAARERRYLGFGVRVECGHAAGFERGHEALLAFVESSLGVFALGNVSEGDDYALDAVLHASVRQDARQKPAPALVFDFTLDSGQMRQHRAGIVAQFVIAQPVSQVGNGTAAVGYPDVEEFAELWGKAQNTQRTV